MDVKYPFNIIDLHTTPLGVQRIKRNLKLPESIDAVEICRNFILDPSAEFERRGKNWYVTTGDVIITINANSTTIITAHNI